MGKFFTIAMLKNAGMVVIGSVIYAKFVKQFADKVI